MNHYENMIEFPQMIERLKEFTVTARAKERYEELKPIMDERELRLRLNETTEARLLLDRDGMPPLSATNEVEKLAEGAERGELLSIDELEQVSQFVTLCMRMKRYLKKSEDQGLRISEYGKGILELDILKEEIERCIRNNRIDDFASKELKEIRRKKENLSNSIRTKLESILRSKKECFSESFVSNRNGHFTLPVKRECKLQISGSVIDVSSSGGTYFIEPTAAGKLRSELGEMEIAESNEERRILYTLSDCVSEFKTEIFKNQEYIEELDYIFAKARLSASMDAVSPEINTERYIRIVNGRHPLISKEKCVPLNLEMGGGIRGIIITGPNTGGKTVALKTAGLFSMMAQCGLHIPCEEATLAMNTQVLCDIGDNQSILENLSTFSAHIKNVIQILKIVDKDSLVLMDELGSGTDPAEGMGIAVAILEELKNSGCNFITTTHYPEVKEYAKETEGIINARMAFDRENLSPLYSLEIGEAGESCALYIAKQLGMSQRMLKSAYNAAYQREIVMGSGQMNETKSSHKEENIDAAFILEEQMQENGEPVLIGDVSKITNTTAESYQTVRKIIPQEKKTETKAAGVKRADRFQIGDSVIVHPQKKTGIVYQSVNEAGEVGVQIQKKKILVNHKRIQVIARAKDMYPEDYDFSIIFESIETRKARHLMDRKYVKDLVIKVE